MSHDSVLIYSVLEKSKHFTIRFIVALISHQDLVLMLGESDHCVKASPAHPRDSYVKTTCSLNFSLTI